MNANSFTGAVYLLKEGQSVSEFSSEMKEAIRKNNWLCGSPEKYFITGINDRYVVVVFGSEERTNVFLNNLKEHYSFIDADIKSVA